MKIITLKNTTSKGGHYSPAVLSQGLLFISGQLAVDPQTGTLAKGGIKEHTAAALANVDQILHETGLSRQDVVQCRVYIPDVTLWDQVDEVYREYFGDHKPARIVVPCNTLHHGSLVEIEAVAEASC